MITTSYVNDDEFVLRCDFERFTVIIKNHLTFIKQRIIVSVTHEIYLTTVANVNLWFRVNSSA